jgi:hypothetical protein
MKFQKGSAKKSNYQTNTVVERERKSERRLESGGIHQIHVKSIFAFKELDLTQKMWRGKNQARDGSRAAAFPEGAKKT